MAIALSVRLVHLGILYSFNMKNKDRISQRLQKANNVLFHAQGVNPLVSVGLYLKIVVPYVLYDSELTTSNLSVISRVQHYTVKCIQGLPTWTRSDMAETMVGLNRLQSQMETRKLMVLHKNFFFLGICDKWYIYSNKIMFLNDKSLVTWWFIPDICQLLSRYRLRCMLLSTTFYFHHPVCVVKVKEQLL